MSTPDSSPPPRPKPPRPPRLPQKWWALAGLGAVVVALVLVPVVASAQAVAPVALIMLLFAWGIICALVNGTALNTLPRATLVQVIAGVVLVILGLWLGAHEDASAIFGFGLLAYPGLALVLNPLVVRLVEGRRAGR